MRIEKMQLTSDEKVLIQVRKHWFLLVVHVVGVVVAAILPLILYGILQISSVLPTIHIRLDSSIVIALYSAWLFLLWMTLFNIWTNYYLDIWTVTTERLIIVDQHGFFSRSVASFRLDRLQDVILTVNGIVATFLDFGTLQIQTAGEEGNFKTTTLPKPAELKSIILRASDNLTTQKNTINRIL